MDYAGSLVAPLLGSFASIYCGALFIATFWNCILLSAIWCRHGWARFALAGFLLFFVAAQLLLTPEAIVRYPFLTGAGLRVIILLSTADVLAAAFLMSATDIRCLSRPTRPRED